MQSLIVEPERRPEVKEINGTLEAMQKVEGVYPGHLPL